MLQRTDIQPFPSERLVCFPGDFSTYRRIQPLPLCSTLSLSVWWNKVGPVGIKTERSCHVHRVRARHLGEFVRSCASSRMPTRSSSNVTVANLQRSRIDTSIKKFLIHLNRDHSLLENCSITKFTANSCLQSLCQECICKCHEFDEEKYKRNVRDTFLDQYC